MHGDSQMEISTAPVPKSRNTANKAEQSASIARIKREDSFTTLGKSDIKVAEDMARNFCRPEELVTIPCSSSCLQIAWTFAKALSPDSVLDGDSILVPAKYASQATWFIKALTN